MHFSGVLTDILRMTNSELFLSGECRFEAVAVSSMWVSLVTYLGDEILSLAVSGIWDLFLDLILVA